MPTLTGVPIRTDVKTMDDVRRSLQAIRSLLTQIFQNGGVVEVLRITDYDALADNRWVYSGYIQRDTVDGDYEDDPDEPFLDGVIYNLIERYNEADPSIHGNSVNSGGSDYPEGFALQPIGGLKGQGVDRNTPLVMAWRSATNPDRWWCQYENAEDGICTIPPDAFTVFGGTATFSGLGGYPNSAIFGGF